MIWYSVKAGIMALGVATVIAIGGAATLGGIHFLTKKKEIDTTEESEAKA